MSCPKCAGNGRYYTEEYAGVWKVRPCLCSHSMTVRQARELEFKNFRKRLDEVYEKSFGGRKQSGSENRELLPTT